MELDTKLLRKLVEEKFDLVKSLYLHNPQGKYSYGQQAFCPFHDNTNTPSAAIYKSTDDRPDSLWCFAEQKQYTVADVLGKLMGYNIYEVGYALWNGMSQVERDEFMARHNQHSTQRMAQAFGGIQQQTMGDTQRVVNLLNEFKFGRITLNNALQQIVEGRNHV